MQMGLIKTIFTFIITVAVVILVGQYFGWWDFFSGALLGSGMYVGARAATQAQDWREDHLQSNWESYTKVVEDTGDTTKVRYVNEDGEIILKYETSGDPSETSLNEASNDNDIKLV